MQLRSLYVHLELTNSFASADRQCDSKNQYFTGVFFRLNSPDG
jgi:hypothetical protein